MSGIAKDAADTWRNSLLFCELLAPRQVRRRCRCPRTWRGARAIAAAAETFVINCLVSRAKSWRFHVVWQWDARHEALGDMAGARAAPAAGHGEEEDAVVVDMKALSQRPPCGDQERPKAPGEFCLAQVSAPRQAIAERHSSFPVAQAARKPADWPCAASDGFQARSTAPFEKPIMGGRAILGSAVCRKACGRPIRPPA